MKSFENHLKSVKSFGESLPLNYRPTMRSSAVFPLVISKGKIESIYTFMGYWLRKRNIALVTAVITTRNSFGDKISVKTYEINSPKSYVFKGSELVNNSEYPIYFMGSVEIEIFSAIDMVFPYPAITFALKGVNGLTFVHTCGRIYNDFEDLEENNELIVPETGFDVLLSDDFEPFFAFVNGPIPVKSQPYSLEIIDQRGNSHIYNKILKKVPQYGLAWIKIFDLPNEREKFWGDKVAVKIKHDFKGFFPRFVAGNARVDLTDISLTHSYYDTSVDISRSAIYTNPNPTEFLDSVVSVPFDTRFEEVELAIYPNFSISPSVLNFELYNSKGNFLCVADVSIKIANGKKMVSYIKLMRLFDSQRESLDMGMVRIIVKGGGTVPTRMKFGLNFIKRKGKTNLPSNICFTANLPNEKILKKPGTFRWCTIFDSENQRIYLQNTSFVKKGRGSSHVSIEVCRECDNKKLIMELMIPQDGTVEVMSDKVDEISKFLCGDIGWISFQCSNPFVFGYYVTDYNNGVVGADHLY
jgi:hypothetical protein